ncbi:MAG: hypothetical protein AAGL49_08000 [Pseudomonadota bacterium]
MRRGVGVVAAAAAVVAVAAWIFIVQIGARDAVGEALAAAIEPHGGSFSKIAPAGAGGRWVVSDLAFEDPDTGETLFQAARVELGGVNAKLIEDIGTATPPAGRSPVKLAGDIRANDLEIRTEGIVAEAAAVRAKNVRVSPELLSMLMAGDRDGAIAMLNQGLSMSSVSANTPGLQWTLSPRPVTRTCPDI